MCGLAVICAPDAGEDLRELALKAMMSALSHRGPDGEGTCSSPRGPLFGHMRLAIQDPDHGQQPVLTEGGHCIAFNGEVYNYRELRAELEATRDVTFVESGDTEVLKESILQWGARAADRFNGDFAIAWTPPDRDVIVLIRDRFGVKPLYYWVDPTSKRALVASEPKAIIAGLRVLDKSFRPRLSKDGFTDTSLYGVPVAPYTLFEGVRAVRPGHVTTIAFGDGFTVTDHAYWDISVGRTAMSGEHAVEAVRTRLTDAVAIRMRSDAGLAMMLSGGLDSSVLTYLSADVDDHQGPPRRAYTIGDPQKAEDAAGTFVSGSDLEYARLVARESRHALVEHTDMTSEPGYFIRKCARARDSIVTLGSEIAMYKLFELIGRQDRVIISGDGADEVFLGYFMQIDASGKVDQYYSSRNSRLLPFVYRKTFLRVREAWSRAESGFRQRLADVDPTITSDNHNLIHYLQLRFTLPYLLDRADTLSMAHSIELRVPYLDHQLVEAVFNTEPALRFTSSEKELLRSAFRGTYNAEVIDRKKSVFPYGESRSYMDSLRREVLAVLDDHTSVVHSVYNAGLLRLAFASTMSFRLLERAVGQFYLHAFICQLISLDELGKEHDLGV